MGPYMLFAGACDDASAAAVRRGLRELQPALAAGSRIIEDLELAATELVTNAVRAGARRVDVELRVLTPAFELRVGDDGAGAPEPREPAAEGASGRGLQIVAALADEWGFTLNTVSKIVWARFLRS